jgi:uncharacterized protein YaeQ
MVFLETVEPQSAGINAYIRKLHSCMFTRGVAMEEQSVALTAQENYLNVRACYTKDREENPTALENFNKRQRTIDMQTYYWVKTLFDPNAPEIKRACSSKVEELALYLFQTRSRSPVVTWGKVEETLTYHENRLITNFQEHPMAAVQERLKEFLEEHRNFQLLPW